MSFVGKVAIVTGASSGIGAATAILFSKEGADVVVVGRNEAKLEKVLEKCAESGIKPLVIKADVSVDSEANSIITKTISKFGKIDILINNAGVIRTGSIMEGTFLDVYETLAKTNLRAVIQLTSLAAPHLAKTKGIIINVSSVAGVKVPTPLLTCYGLTKAALNYFSYASTMELSPLGIRVNTITPGPVHTDIWENSGEDLSYLNDVHPKYAFDRVSHPDEIAHLILFLASDKAVGIAGANFVTDNGYLAVN